VSESTALPSFTGLLVHREPTLGYSFLVPDGWQRGEFIGAEGTAALYAPSTPEMFASFSVEGRDLGVEITSADLPDLRAGFLRGLRTLPGARVTLVDATAIGRLISLEAHQTYRDDQNVRKRWVRLLYQGTVQVRLIAQAATVQEFDYWLPMFYESMRTFQFGDWALAAGVAADDWQ
jgi:hypothetical protein